MALDWLFDFDDTLTSNQRDYDHAIITLAEFMFRIFGHKSPDLQVIVNVHIDIDTKNVERFGFSKERFPTSCMQTYEAICNTLHFPVSPRHREFAYEIGMRAFNEETWKANGMLPGAEETLEFLLAQGDTLFLLTKGDKEIQQGKIRVHQLEKYFKRENIAIAPRKDKEVIERMLAGRDKNRVYSVGNSIRSDVNPSLEAGVKVIYIPCETWQWEKEHHGVPEHPNLTTLGNIIEIKEKYELFSQRN